MSKTAKKTELAEVKSQMPAINGDVGDFFEDVAKDTADILIPRLLLMHGLSKAVGDEKAEAGDIINSVTLEVLGSKKQPVEVIPIKVMPKTWVIEEHDGQKWNFRRIEPWKPLDKDLPWEFTERDEESGGEKKMRRNQCLNFFVLLTRDATQTQALPYMLSLRRTSYNAGRKLHTYFETSRMAFQGGNKNSIPMAKVWALSSKMEKGELGSYQVFQLDEKRPANPDELAAGIQWFKNLKNTQVKVDDREEGESESTVQAGVVNEDAEY
jgi:hypothetical protein